MQNDFINTFCEIRLHSGFGCGGRSTLLSAMRCEARVQGSGCRVEGLESSFQGLGGGVWGSGFWGLGLGFGV